MLFLILWGLIFNTPSEASSDFQYTYPHYYSSFQSQQHSPIISMDLDPQHQLDSAFRVAAREDRLQDMVRAFQNGAHVDAPSDRGRTALMFAARNCSVPIAHELLKLNANVNAQDLEGETPIEYATLESCLPVVRMLLKTPVELGLKDRSGKTVFDYASDCASLDVDGPAAQILELLRKKKQRAR